MCLSQLTGITGLCKAEANPVELDYSQLQWAKCRFMTLSTAGIKAFKSATSKQR